MKGLSMSQIKREIKGYYLATFSVANQGSGVVSKIETQINAFRNAGFSCQLLLSTPHYKNRAERMVLSRLPFTKISDDWDSLRINENTDFLYIRHPAIDRGFVNFLKKTSIEHKVRSIIIEFPTYPYDQEYHFRTYPYLFKERFWRKQLYRYVDVIVTYSNDKAIFDIPCINIMNGIDVNLIGSTTLKSRFENEIHLAAVASMKPWHGFDRVIRGLKNYYNCETKQKVVVKLHLMGNGPEIPKYRRLIKDYNLEDYVIFHGDLPKKVLFETMAKCNIAVASLAFHRTNIFLSSALKTREYAAVGLPIISSCAIDAFPSEKCDFIFNLPPDETDIEIPSILDFYYSLQEKYITPQLLAGRIRKFCLDYCDINVTMRPIINFIEKF